MHLRFFLRPSIASFVCTYVLVAIRDGGIRAKYTHWTQCTIIYLHPSHEHLLRTQRRTQHTDKVSSYARHGPRDPLITTSQFSIKEDGVRLRSRPQFFSHVARSAHTEPHHPPSWMRSLIIVPRSIFYQARIDLPTVGYRSPASWFIIGAKFDLVRTVGPVARVCGSGYFMSRRVYTDRGSPISSRTDIAGVCRALRKKYTSCTGCHGSTFAWFAPTVDSSRMSGLSPFAKKFARLSSLLLPSISSII